MVPKRRSELLVKTWRKTTKRNQFSVSHEIKGADFVAMAEKTPSSARRELKPKSLRGSIERIPSGHYRARIRIGHRRPSFTDPQIKNALAWLRGMNKRRPLILSGLLPRADSRSTFGKLFEGLEEQYRRAAGRSLTTSTAEGYLRILPRLARHWGRRQVAELRPRDVKEWIRHLEDDGLRTSTIRNLLNQLDAAIRYGLEEDLIDRRPCEIVRPEIATAGDPRLTSEEDLVRLIDAAETERDPRPGVIVALGAFLGLRRSEMLRLRGSHLAPGSVRVPDRAEGGVRTRAAQGRDVPTFHNPALAAPLSRLAAEPGLPLLEGLESPQSITHCAGYVYRQALGHEPCLHELRHRWATRLGMDPRITIYQLMAWGGWRSLSVVQRYVHPLGVPVEQLGPIGSTLWPTYGPRSDSVDRGDTG